MTTSAPTALRTAVPGGCRRCGGSDIAAYDVIAEAGWVHVVKCQDCLASLERQPLANRLGPITLLTDLI